MVICTTSVIGYMFLREDPEELGLTLTGLMSLPRT